MSQVGCLTTVGTSERSPALPPEGLAGGWIVYFDGRPLYWSPEMFEIFGVGDAAFEPSVDGVLEFVHPEDVEAFQANVGAGLASRSPVSHTYRITRGDGEIRLLETRGWHRAGEGEMTSVHGTTRDITDSAAAAKERERLSRQQAMILHATGDGICGLDQDGRISFCNPALLTLLRRDGESLNGLLLHELVHRMADGRECHALGACPFNDRSEATIRASDLDFHCADGVRLEVGYVLVSVAEPDFAGSVISFRDITARRTASRRLQTNLQEVRALSGQRGALLQDLAAAEERERLRIAGNLHDDTIQSLDAIRLRLEYAQGQTDDQPLLETLADAESQTRGIAERLRQLMFELMPPIAERDLHAAVESYCAVVLAGSPLAYEVRGGPRGLGADTELLAYRLVQEAIRNALKHSHGTRLRIAFELAADELVATVSDDGVGFPGGPETEPTHAGIRIMRQRAQVAGGSAVFEPGLDGHGLAVTFHLPLEATEVP